MNIQASVDVLKKDMTNRNIKRFLNKSFKTKYMSGEITKREYKQSKKLLVRLLR